MDQIRRIIIQKSDNGFMFSIKDLGHPYTEAAPVNKVVLNGPADCAGLRPGDGLVSINSNLVKGRSYSDLCYIIKGCRGTSLELAIIENLFALPNKLKINEEEILNFNTNTLLHEDNTNIEEALDEELINQNSLENSPKIIRKKAYTYDKGDFKAPEFKESLKKMFNSSFELSIDTDSYEDSTSVSDFNHSRSSKFQQIQPKITYKAAKSPLLHKNEQATNESTNDRNNDRELFSNLSNIPMGIIPPTNNNNNYSKGVLPKCMYHQAYNKQNSSTSPPASSSSYSQHYIRNSNANSKITKAKKLLSYDHKSQLNSNTNENKLRRGSTPLSMTDQSTPDQSIKSEYQMSTSSIPSPKLQLNRVGGLVRAPISPEDNIINSCSTTTSNNNNNNCNNMDNTMIMTTDLDDSNFIYNEEDNNNTSADPIEGSKKQSHRTISVEEEDLIVPVNAATAMQHPLSTTTTTSTPALVNVKHKYRHLHCSPMPYKSSNASSNLQRNSQAELSSTSSMLRSEKSPSISSNMMMMTASNSPPTHRTVSPIISLTTSDKNDTYLGSTKLEQYNMSSAMQDPAMEFDLIDGIRSDTIISGASFPNNNTTNVSHSQSHNYDETANATQTPSAGQQHHYQSHHASTSSKHLKKLKSIFGDNYRGRSKTLDSDRKLKEDDETDQKIDSINVMVKWIMYEGKQQKTSWRQYNITLDENRLIFTREKTQMYLASASLEEVTMVVRLPNCLIEEESERRGRKNIIRIYQSSNFIEDSQESSLASIGDAGKATPTNASSNSFPTECLVEFIDKSTETRWFNGLLEKSRIYDKDDRNSRSASFKERHSLTVPNLYSKDSLSVQSQFSKTKSKSKDESSCLTSQININPSLNTSYFTQSHPAHSHSNILSSVSNYASHQPLQPHQSKGVIHQAMSKVKNLKHKFASTPASDFERQQEEWFNRQQTNQLMTNQNSGSSGLTNTISNSNSSSNQSGANAGVHPGINNPGVSGQPMGVGALLSASNSYSEDIAHYHTASAASQQSYHSGGGLANDQFNDCGVPLSGSIQSNNVPLQKWQRSIVSPMIPLVVEMCISIIEKFGMNLVGLYRVSGNKIALDAILHEFRKPVNEIDVTSDKWNDIHAISGVLKSYFRNLPDGLFPKDLYNEVLGACRIHEADRARRLLSLQRILSIMDVAQDRPEYRHHRETLRYLVEHLSRVASRQAINKMTARNLAVVFAPTLMKPPLETSQILVNDYKYKIQLVETLIKYHKWLFSPSLESGCTIPPDLDDDETLYNPPEDSSIAVQPYDVTETISADFTEARPLVKDILERVAHMNQEHLHQQQQLMMIRQKSSSSSYGGGVSSDEHPINQSDSNYNINSNIHLTLAELTRQAHKENTKDLGYKEVDIDEECDRRQQQLEQQQQQEEQEDNQLVDINELRMNNATWLQQCSTELDQLKEVENNSLESMHNARRQRALIDRELADTQAQITHIENSSVPTSTSFDLNSNLN